MKKLITTIMLVMMMSMSLAMAFPTVSVPGTPSHTASADVDNRGVAPDPIDFPKKKQYDVVSSNTNSRSCDPIWRGSKGTPSCFDESTKENVAAGFVSGSGEKGICPSLNPDFVECVGKYSDTPMNDGRDFENAKNYWGFPWVERVTPTNMFQSWKASFSWLDDYRANRVLRED